ncbi:MAG: SirB2 family protein [Gammaproteobacteria bacterium]|nr:SirB2 family protein [Gammaproteobacteria bacterium]
MYFLLKHLHITFVYLSFALLLFRGYRLFLKGGMGGSPWLTRFPLALDAGVLLSGFFLWYVLALPLFDTPWLMAKLAALVAYIGLANLALRFGKDMKIRALAFAGAVLSWLYIAGAATLKSAWAYFL